MKLLRQDQGSGCHLAALHRHLRLLPPQKLHDQVVAGDAPHHCQLPWGVLLLLVLWLHQDDGAVLKLAGAHVLVSRNSHLHEHLDGIHAIHRCREVRGRVVPVVPRRQLFWGPRQQPHAKPHRLCIPREHRVVQQPAALKVQPLQVLMARTRELLHRPHQVRLAAQCGAVQRGAAPHVGHQQFLRCNHLCRQELPEKLHVALRSHAQHCANGPSTVQRLLLEDIRHVLPFPEVQVGAHGPRRQLHRVHKGPPGHLQKRQHRRTPAAPLRQHNGCGAEGASLHFHEALPEATLVFNRHLVISENPRDTAQGIDAILLHIIEICLALGA
mmetsp:Transcript_86132/g.206381  ORF Transcript_86132/g.206381 Transcript_86132/m.206381 type:complete len:327 (-) Transcript_86132:2189-3169(-)